MVPIQKFIVFITILSLWQRLAETQSYTSVAPSWVTSNFMRAGSQDVIATATGSSIDPIFTFTFSSPLPGVPNLAYGIRTYRGSDTIREQIFEIRKLALNSTSFRVQIDIVGSTTILTLNVPYLAIDPNFPHHLNSFDNVPINYGKTLTNITSKESFTTYYSNTINYTQQATGRPYSRFTTPLDGNKILLYITSISIKATGKSLLGTKYPVNINVSSKIMSTETYSLSVSVSIEVAIAKLQFSMIVFNANDVESSKKYVIVYNVWETTNAGGFIQVPSAFVDNFILGLTDFSTVDGMCIISYQWSFTTLNGIYGVQLATSIPGNGYDCALSRMKSTVFYMKTWQCPSKNPYFNLTTNLCQTGCGAYFYANTSVLQCHECEWACSRCVNSTFCSGCDSVVDFRILANVSGKPTCVCMPGYYQNPTNSSNKVCLPCIANCLTCNTSTVCQVCNQVGGFIMTTDRKCKRCGYGCLSCNEVPYVCYECKAGMIFDDAQKKCVCVSGTYPSNLTVDCLACDPSCGACTGPSSSECTNCSTSSPVPFFNETTKQCQSTCGKYFFEDWLIFNCSRCPNGCTKCSGPRNCTECDYGRMLMSDESEKNFMCIKCPQNCAICSSETNCTQCANQLPGYAVSLSSGQCSTACGYGCGYCIDDQQYNTNTNTKDHILQVVVHDQQNFAMCLICADVFIIGMDGQCVCPPGTIPSSTDVSCIKCHPTCKNCTGPSQFNCTSCYTTVDSVAPFFNATSHQCQSTCPDYFYHNWQNFTCSECPVGCFYCTSPKICKVCDDQTNNRKLQVSPEGFQSCPCIKGYYQDTIDPKNNVCIQCNISNCLDCNSSTTCTLCNELTGHVLDATGQCKFCGFGCLSCNATDCQQCKTGMVYDGVQKKCVCISGTYPSDDGLLCLACHALCGACTGPSSSQCTNCSTSSNVPFFNETTNQCQSTCGDNFYEDRLIFSCVKCPVGCDKCSGPNNCTACDLDKNKRSLTSAGSGFLCTCIQGYYQDTEDGKNNVCLQCSQNCADCIGQTNCSKCVNKLPGFALTSFGNCMECGYGCAFCFGGNDTSCGMCANGFSLNKNGQCACLPGTTPSATDVSCITCHSKCKTCTGPSQFNCTSCHTNSTAPYFNSTTSSCQSSCGLYFFENVTAFQCQKCLFNCRDCAKTPECTKCDLQNHFRKIITKNGQRTCSCIVGYYQDPENASNPVCKKCIDNCLTCKDNSTCDGCNQAAGFIQAANKTCIPCGFGCVSCNQVNMQCIKCKSEFVLNLSTKQCQCPNGTVKAVSSLTCTSCHPICKTCAGPSQYECLSCSTDQNRISLKQSNNMVQCICDPFAYMEPTDGSLNCVKKTNESCDYGFIYIREKKSCIEICGDGKNFGMYQCDDGNLVDGDGCSKTCQVQQDFDCKKVDGTDTCYYVGIVNIVKAKAYKYPLSNNLLIQCKLDPIKKFFYNIDWKSGLLLIGPKMEVLDSWMEGEWLNINTTYFEDLTGKTLTIKYSTGLAKNKTIRETGRTLFESVFDFDITLRDYELPIVPSNNIKPAYFQADTYETVKAVQKSLFTTATCTIVMILAAFVLKTVFPFWQLVFSLQAIFLSLGVINYMNPLLTGLTEFSVVKGLRSTKIYFENLVSPNTVIEYNISSLGYVSSFFGNMNIMMFIWIAMLLTSGALFLMSKKDLTMGFPFQFCKRSLMLLVLFSSMGYTFSVGLITSTYPFELIVASICGVITLGQIYNLLKNMKRYYHFDKTFDLTNRKVKYVVAMIIFIRISQALVISLFRNNTFVAACIILAAQVFLTTGFIIFRPYTKSLYNLLNIIGELAVTGFLSIDLILNINVITAVENENILSYVQISINFLIVLLMVGCFVYAVVTDFCMKEKGLDPLKFEEFEAEKSDSANEQKKSLEVSREKFDLRIEDFEDNSSAIINDRNSKFLIVSH